MVKNPPDNVGHEGLNPGSGRSPGEGNGSAFQYSCQGDPTHKRSLTSYSPRAQKRVRRDLATQQQQHSQSACFEAAKWEHFTDAGPPPTLPPSW